MMIWVRLWQLAHIVWPRLNIIRIVICIFRFWKLACIVWQGTSSQNQNSYLGHSVCHCWPSINTLLSKIKHCTIHFYKSKASKPKVFFFPFIYFINHLKWKLSRRHLSMHLCHFWFNWISGAIIRAMIPFYFLHSILELLCHPDCLLLLKSWSRDISSFTKVVNPILVYN